MALPACVYYILCIALSAEMWRMGGNGYSLCRNPLVPCIIGFTKVFLLGGNWWALLYVPALYLLIQGFSYGLNAPIHKFWVKVFGKGGDGNYLPVEMITRGTVGLFWSMAGAVFAVITGHWVAFLGYTTFLTVANAVFGTMEDVEISERLVGASVAMAVLI